MANGISTLNLEPANVVDDIIGNRAGLSVRMTIARLVEQVKAMIGPTYETKSELDDDLSWDAGAIAGVFGDPDPDLNGIYKKEGAFDDGSWTWIGDIGGDLIASLTAASIDAVAARIAAEASASSAASDASIASTSATSAALAALAAGAPIFTTIANGEAATVDTDVFMVPIEPGMAVYENVSGSGTFLGWLGELIFENAQTLLASALTGFAVGQIIRTRQEGFAYKVAPALSTDHDVATDGAVPLYVLAGDGGYNIKAFGAAGDGITDDYAPIQAALDKLRGLGGGVVWVPSGHYIIRKTLRKYDNTWVRGEGRSSLIENTLKEGDAEYLYQEAFVIVDGWSHEADWKTQTFYPITMVKGEAHVTLATPANGANLTVGQVVFLYRGFPAHSKANNSLWAELFRVISVDLGTGDVVFDTFIPTSSGAKMGNSVAPDWEGTADYSIGDKVWYDGFYYASLVDNNVLHPPVGTSNIYWQIETIALTPNTGDSGFGAAWPCYTCFGGGITDIAVKNVKAPHGKRARPVCRVFIATFTLKRATLF